MPNKRRRHARCILSLDNLGTLTTIWYDWQLMKDGNYGPSDSCPGELSGALSHPEREYSMVADSATFLIRYSILPKKEIEC